MEKKEISIFIQKMMDKIVQFYYNEVKEEFGGVGYDTNEESFIRALDLVKSTAFVSADLDNNKMFLYALDPYAFINFNVSGHCDLWNFLSNWAKSCYNITLAIGKFSVNETNQGVPIYHDTKNYLLESKRMVDDDAMAFKTEFLETE
mgnify:CR=1 FL=1